jgi:hypothetical protein
MNDSARRTDRELFDAVASGEAGALAELAARHARGLFDFALRSTLDEAQSAAVVEAAIRRVRQPGAQAPNQIDFRTWLYSTGLMDVLAVSNEQGTARISMEDERFFQRTANIDPDLARWTWQAARVLRTRDYCVLDLTLRRGLTPEELADAASLTRSNLYGSIGRARGAFEETFAAMVLFDRGRGACGILYEIVDSSPGTTLRPALLQQIIEHAEDCQICRQTLDSVPPAANIFVSLADISIPDTLVQRLLQGAGEPRSPGYLPPRQTALFTGAAGPALTENRASGSSRAVESESWGDDSFDQRAQREERSISPAAAVPTASEAAAMPRTAQPQPPAGRPRPAPRTHQDTPDTGFAAAPSLRPPVMWTYVLLGVVAVLAIYLGVAVADSLQGGGGDSGAVPLDAASEGVSGRVIACGDPPLEMQHAASTVVSFDEAALDGFQISAISYVPVSETAAPEDLEGTLENPFLIRLTAAQQDATPPRTEEFVLHIEWQRGEEVATSDCPLFVRVGT